MKPVLQFDVGCCQVSCSVVYNLMVGHLLVPALVDVDHLVDLAKFDHRVTVWSLLIVCRSNWRGSVISEVMRRRSQDLQVVAELFIFTAVLRGVISPTSGLVDYFGIIVETHWYILRQNTHVAAIVKSRVILRH